MEALVKNHLQGAQVNGNTIVGYLEGEENYAALLRDIDNSTGGFNVSHSRNDSDEPKRLYWQLAGKVQVNFFGSPFQGAGFTQLPCVHSGQKRVHNSRNAPDVSTQIN